MMRFLTNILFLGVAGLVFFGFTTQHYANIQKLQADERDLTSASEKMRQLNEARNELLARYNGFSETDLDRVKKALPDNVDNVKLVRDIDGIAARYGMTVRKATVQLEEDAPGIITDENASPYASVTLSFAVSGPYKTFLSFLRDLEQSLRVVDVTDITFNANDKDSYEYMVSLKTYWLK
ncbi:MAG: type I CRISPR-associated protein Cas7 [Candidatus Yonathbacteria bacterium]|nr:type I CRISPR-associated protein Cas7 [Candidatus Yonathbacteria bacterium]